MCEKVILCVPLLYRPGEGAVLYLERVLSNYSSGSPVPLALTYYVYKFPLGKISNSYNYYFIQLYH